MTRNLLLRFCRWLLESKTTVTDPESFDDIAQAFLVAEACPSCKGYGTMPVCHLGQTEQWTCPSCDGTCVRRGLRSPATASDGGAGVSTG
jgi:DnaJ-class molecular chaperone